jgi:FkbM family methyltransferase
MFKRIKSIIKTKALRTVGMTYNDVGVSFVLATHLSRLHNIVLIDVGAHTGDFAMSIDRLCGIQNGVLFEPQPKHAELLRRKMDRSRFKVHECVVADSDSTRTLEINEFDATSSTLSAMRDSPHLAGVNVRLRNAVECRSTTLDSALEDERFVGIDLVKIDVQGAEMDVIKGATTTLSKTTMVWIEVSFKPLYQGSCVFGEVYDIMSQQGFRLVELDPGFRSPSGELLQADALFTKL